MSPNVSVRTLHSLNVEKVTMHCVQLDFDVYKLFPYPISTLVVVQVLLFVCQGVNFLTDPRNAECFAAKMYDNK